MSAAVVVAVLLVALVLGGLALDGGRLPGVAGIEARTPAPVMSFTTFGLDPATIGDARIPAAAASRSASAAAPAKDADTAVLALDEPAAAGVRVAPGRPAESATEPAAPSQPPVARTAPAKPAGGGADVLVPTGTRARPIRATFLGDSYTTGWNGYGRGSLGWPAIVARNLGWRVTNLAVAGTGFVNPGWTGQPLRTRIAATVRSRPQVVVVAMGHNDSRYGAAAASAARRDLARLRARLPHATIVVVAPIWANGSPPASMLRLRTVLKRQAKAIDAVFIDPLAAGWFAGSNHRLISGDGIHPTNAGHRHIARLVLRSLRP